MSIAELESWKNVPALIRVLRDKDYQRRREAARALGRIGDARARSSRHR